jgi:hypothetical protein
MSYQVQRLVVRRPTALSEALSDEVEVEAEAEAEVERGPTAADRESVHQVQR